MVSREHKKAGLLEQLQLLRSITHSNAGFVALSKKTSTKQNPRTSNPTRRLPPPPQVNKTSIIVDAARYIEQLKQKVAKLNQEIAVQQTTMPMVTVQNLSNGFLINVISIKNMPGLLVTVLDAFEELGLHVLEVKASCADSFRLEAIGGENQEIYVDAHTVKEAVLQAIRNCSDED